MHRKQIQIRWRDMDNFGHVNNAVYLNYLEEVRDEWIERTLGSEEAAWDFVVARVAIDYRDELRQSDGACTATCRLGSISKSSFTTCEQIIGPSGELAAEAETVMVARDRESGRSRPLTEPERAALEAVS